MTGNSQISVQIACGLVATTFVRTSFVHSHLSRRATCKSVQFWITCLALFSLVTEVISASRWNWITPPDGWNFFFISLTYFCRISFSSSMLFNMSLLKIITITIFKHKIKFKFTLHSPFSQLPLPCPSQKKKRKKKADYLFLWRPNFVTCLSKQAKIKQKCWILKWRWVTFWKWVPVI